MFLLYWNKRKTRKRGIHYGCCIPCPWYSFRGSRSVGSGFNWVGIIIGVIGLILAVLGKKDPKNAGMANAGLVLSLILYVACVAAVSGAASFLDSLT